MDIDELIIEIHGKVSGIEKSLEAFSKAITKHDEEIKDNREKIVKNTGWLSGRIYRLKIWILVTFLSSATGLLLFLIRDQITK